MATDHAPGCLVQTEWLATHPDDPKPRRDAAVTFMMPPAAELASVMSRHGGRFAAGRLETDA